MKRLTVLLIMASISSVEIWAGTTSYEQKMLENIEFLYQANTSNDYQAAINNFERIANKETDKWEPHYYMAFAYLMMAADSQVSIKKDNYLDLAMKHTNKGLELAPHESELVSLAGFNHMLRITVDPATRGPQYSGLAMQAFGKALHLNPENPRATYLMAEMELGTARFFGSDLTEPCKKLAESVEQFDIYVASNRLAPTWGKKNAAQAAQACK